MSDMSAQPASYVDNYQPPTGAAPAASSAPSVASQSPAQSPVSQTLQDQNIFELLGVTDATEDERERFLDELQQVIWEDFLENDVKLLVTEEEMGQLRQILDKPGDELQKQEETIVFLEKLIPDLEEILLEKALELKADMVKERLAGMRELYAGQADQLKVLQAADEALNDDQWRTVAELLNSIS